MRVTRKDFLLYGITDRACLPGGRSLYEAVEEALKNGLSMLQLREKELQGEALFSEAKELQRLCRRYGVPFLINDDVSLAREIRADGVHVGQQDMAADRARRELGAGKLIGVTAKTVEQAVRAEQAGADYLGSGAVFASKTKAGASPMSLPLLSEIAKSVQIPVVAIGGIRLDNAAELRGSGISGYAAAGGIFGAENIAENTAGLRRLAERDCLSGRERERSCHE